MKVSDYARTVGISRAGAYYRVYNHLIPAHTHCGHWEVDEFEIDWEAREQQVDCAVMKALLEACGWKTKSVSPLAMEVERG